MIYSAYAPQSAIKGVLKENAKANLKNKKKKLLEEEINKEPETHANILYGDFNARLHCRL